MENITVVLASDDNYSQHVAVTSASILCNTQYPAKITFYVFSDAIAEYNKNKIQKTIASLGGHVQFLEVQNIGVDGFTSGHISKAAYLRLKISSLLPYNITRAIYFDADLVVLDDIHNLWNISLEGKPIGAVCDFGIMSSKRMMRQKEQSLGLGPRDAYFNSGVLLIDVAQWRINNYEDKVIDCARKNKFRHHDQDALNKIFLHNWKELPLQWNVIPPVFTLPLKILLNVDYRKKSVQALRHPAVFHWAGRYKPWEFALHPHFNTLYYTYLKQTAFQHVSMPQPGKDMKHKSIFRQELRMQWAKLWL